MTGALAAARIVLAKDARVLLRRRGLLAMLLLYPMLAGGILGFAFVAQDVRVPVALVVQDEDGVHLVVDGEAISIESLRDALAQAADVRSVRTLDEGVALLSRGEVDAVLVIPPHFLQDVRSLVRTTNVTIVLDRSDPVRAQVADSLLRGVAQEFIERFVRLKMTTVLSNLRLALEGGPALPGVGDLRGFRQVVVDLETLRHEANLTPDQARLLDADLAFLRLAVGVLEDSSTYLRATALPVEVQERGVLSGRLSPAQILAPITVALSVFWTATLAGAAVVGLEHPRGLLPRLLAYPVPVAGVAAGKAGLALAIVGGETILLLVAGAALTSLPTAGLPLAVAAILAAGAALAGVGALLGSLARGLSDAVLVAAFLAFPMFLVSGVLFPVAFMPGPVASVAAALPGAVALEATRAALLRGVDLATLAPALAYLLAVAVGTWAATSAALRWRARA
ncbi:MAG TPA: ABC transporter permease [Candidatus Thermoplasmatota archaeon]|nr:ABC transporter permease [Candidatus Thermoplasmatota archaeon]